MNYTYNPNALRHCDACGLLGHVGGMLHQPGNIWVHKYCAGPHTRHGIVEHGIRNAIRRWRRKLKHARREPRYERQFVMKP